MRAYKVIFENNVAVSASPIVFFHSKDSKKAEHKDRKDLLPWLIVMAKNEDDGIRIASKMIKEHSGLLGLS